MSSAVSGAHSSEAISILNGNGFTTWPEKVIIYLDGVPARIGNWSLRQCRVKGVAITSLAELAFAFEDRKVCLHNPQFLLHKILVVKFAMHLPSMNVCSAHT